MLIVEDVTKAYRPPRGLLKALIRTAATEPVTALRGVSFQVDAGEVVGLVGPNGAGKTTLIRLIASLLEPDSGRVLIGGLPAADHPGETRRRVGLVLSDDRGLYWRLTGRQNLEFFGVMAGLAPPEARLRTGELLERLDLARRDKLVFGYSAGMRTRLNLARALLPQPDLLLLDEPTLSLDPVATRQVGALLRNLAADGRAVLLSSHRLDEVAEICDRVVVLIDGSVRYVGSPAELADGRSPTAAIGDLLAGEAGA